MKNIKNKKLIVFIASFAIVFLVAIIGSLFTSTGVQSEWYEGIKTPITPPNFVFLIVWNLIFILIALSLAFSWLHSKGLREKRWLVFAFGANFILNVLWSILYFGFRSPLLAFINIIFLLVSIVYLMVVVWEINRKATFMIVPYLIWVNFVAVLNWLSL